MENAHLRFARLIYELAGERRRTSIAVHVDRLIAEPTPTSETVHQGHLLSVLGNDAQIGAIHAAIAKSSTFAVRARGSVGPLLVSLEQGTVCYKGNLTVPGRMRPLRHLLALSPRWIAAAKSPETEEVFLLDASPDWVWTNVAYIYGLPGLPEWANWFHAQLEKARALVPLIGIGCDPVQVKGKRDDFLAWLGQGVAAKELTFPAQNGPISWPKLELRKLLIPLPEEQRRRSSCETQTHSCAP